MKKSKPKKKNYVAKALSAVANVAAREVLSRTMGPTMGDLAHSVGKEFVGSFKKGGRIKKTGLALVHKGETVVPKGGGKLRLSNLATKLLRAYTHPFSREAEGAHFLDTPNIRSQKVMGFIRGTAVIGTSNFGFIAIAPTLANDTPCVYYTTTAYALAQTTPPPSDSASITGGANYPAIATMSNLPYTKDQLNAPIAPNTIINGRMVSVSLKVSYVGTTLNQSGLSYIYSDPDCDNVLGPSKAAATAPGTTDGYNTSQLSSKLACEIVDFDRKGAALICLPSGIASQTEYPQPASNTWRKLYPYCQGSTYTINGTANTYGVASSVIAFTGVAGQSVYFEAVIHSEYEGPGVSQALLTSSIADSDGCDAVLGMLQNAQYASGRDPRLTFQQSVSQEMKRQGIIPGRGLRTITT